MKQQFEIGLGQALPYGATVQPTGINFSIAAQKAISVTLCLFPFENQTLVKEIQITYDPKKNRTGNVWHIFIKSMPLNYAYGYRFEGPSLDRNNLILDPYAKGTTSPIEWQKSSEDSSSYAPLGIILPAEEFDWKGVERPNIPQKDLIIYEMHVRGFTQHPSSKVKHPGTFLGVIEKISYLRQLGINAVELMPVFEFNEAEHGKINPETGNPLYNFWGYSTVNFFSPMNRYGSSGCYHTCNEFKTMVRELHAHGIEVILDVVYNHTAEGNEDGPVLSFKGIDSSAYYLLNDKGEHLNYTGCGNTVNANTHIMRELILASLRYWAIEMRVDGFRFDLATVFGIDKEHQFLSFSSIVEAISTDPLLAGIKLIAEPWHFGHYRVGSFYPEYKWGEWNGKYRDDVRQFIKGDANKANQFATRLCGSQDLYQTHRNPYHSINFVTAHDGFTLKDMVSYNQKHNNSNAENNADGSNENDSWNCGIEGLTSEKTVQALRQKQIRNHLLALFISQGTPLLLQGDEYGHTKRGNNNTYCHDSEINWFLWDELEKPEGAALFRFMHLLIELRRQHPILRQENFLTEKNITWHGIEAYRPLWKNTSNEVESKFIAFTLHDHERGEDLYVGFNASNCSLHVKLPSAAVKSDKRKWQRLIDTSLPSPDDFIETPQIKKSAEAPYLMAPYSSILLKWVSK